MYSVAIDRTQSHSVAEQNDRMLRVPARQHRAMRAPSRPARVPVSARVRLSKVDRAALERVEDLARPVMAGADRPERRRQDVDPAPSQLGSTKAHVTHIARKEDDGAIDRTVDGFRVRRDASAAQARPEAQQGTDKGATEFRGVA